MQSLQIPGLLALSFFISITLTPFLRKISLKYDLLDRPEDRKIHQKSMPYLGGAAIYVSFISGTLLTFLHFEWINAKEAYIFIVSSSMIFLLGLYDDLKKIKGSRKLIIQTLIAFFCVYNGISVKQITNPISDGVIQLGWMGDVISVIWIVTITNSINLLDGLDGLAAGVSAILLCFMLGFAIFTNDIRLIGLLSSLLGGIAGFLVFNFPPAKIFMGDSGSLLIGLLFSLFCILPPSKGSYTITILIPAILVIIPVLDIFLAVIRRTFKGYSIFLADKKHLHHRILRLNDSYTKTLFIIYGANIFVGLLAIAAFFLPNQVRLILLVMLGQNIIFGLLILRIMEKVKK